MPKTNTTAKEKKEMETRGRKQNSDILKKIHEAKENGYTVVQIAEKFELSEPMVRYYLRHEVKEIKKRESLVSCFYRQPRAIQERIAAEIGYILPPAIKEEETTITYNKIQKTMDNYNDLRARCEKLLKGEILPMDIDENFTIDERHRLSKSNKFMGAVRALLTGESINFPIEEILSDI